MSYPKRRGERSNEGCWKKVRAGRLANILIVIKQVARGKEPVQETGSAAVQNIKNYVRKTVRGNGRTETSPTSTAFTGRER